MRVLQQHNPFLALVRLCGKPKKKEVANDLGERMRRSHSLEAAGHRWWGSRIYCLLYFFAFSWFLQLLQGYSSADIPSAVKKEE